MINDYDKAYGMIMITTNTIEQYKYSSTGYRLTVRFLRSLRVTSGFQNVIATFSTVQTFLADLVQIIPVADNNTLVNRISYISY